MKASILKKVNVIIEEANSYKDKSNYNKAIQKLLEAIDFINEKVKETEDKETEISNIKNVINQTYSIAINDITQQAIRYVAQKEFNKAKDAFQGALEVADKIDDPDLKSSEIEEIEKLSHEASLKELIEEGIDLRNKKKFDEAINKFNKAIVIAEEIYDTITRSEQLDLIKNQIDDITSSKVKLVLNSANQLKQVQKEEDAIKEFNKALKLTDTFHNSDKRKKEANSIKNLINEIYSNQIKPHVEKIKEFIKKDYIEQAILESENTLKIANSMFDSDLKNLEINLIAEVINPYHIEKIKPIIQKGKEITKQEKFESSTVKINEAVKIFKEALKIANSMGPSERKQREIKEIQNLINNACLSGVNLIKENSVQNIMQKKYDDAISQLYSAISIAKIMTYPEDENEEIENLKNLVNKVYSAQVNEVLTRCNKILNEDKYDEAIIEFNEALNITNKMYLTEEMEKIVGDIKGLIYQTEIKQLVGKGGLADAQKLKEKEIEKLKKRLDYANSIEDDKRRIEEMTKIKKEIDKVHSEEIRLLAEQGNQLAKQNEFEKAFNFFERALKVNDLMEMPDLQNKNLIRECYKNELINKAKSDITQGSFDKAIESCSRATELDENYVEAYFHCGLAYYKKRKYEAAIPNFNKAVRLNSNHFESWNNLGLTYEAKNEFDKAIESYQKATQINSKYAEAFFNMANSYKSKKQYDLAIKNYKTAIELDPKFAKAWFFMAAAYCDKKDYNLTVQFLEKAINLDPNLGKEVSLLLTDFKDIVDELESNLSEKFINR